MVTETLKTRSLAAGFLIRYLLAHFFAVYYHLKFPLTPEFVHFTVFPSLGYTSIIHFCPIKKLSIPTVFMKKIFTPVLVLLLSITVSARSQSDSIRYKKYM